MAARLFQDQNLIDHVNGVGALGGTISGKAEFTGQGKGRVGGRKPLGDLSNAGKPINQVDGKKALIGSLNTGKLSVSQISKSLKPKNTTTINNEAVSAKAKNVASNKATEKSHTGGRKALSDISNSGKPHVSEKKNKNSLKSSLPLSAIAEEQIFHNHTKCIKPQFETVDIHHFFKTVGLEDDSNDRTEISIEVPAFGKLKYESEYLELEEVPEHLPEVPSLSEHGSPAHCKSPKCTMWNDFAVNFKLIETPKLSKN